MRFASRQDAGNRLAGYLRERGVDVDAVLGLPRGGVVVAAEVARVLQRPLDVLVVRKIGHPLHREFAVGAMAEHGIVLLDEHAIGSAWRVKAELDKVIAEERIRMREYEARFHHGARVDLSGKNALLVDDGLATGATAEAAILSAREQGARAVFMAAPVASINAVQRLERIADKVIALWADPAFEAVGQYYDAFSQTTDEEVLDLLKSEQVAR